MSQVKRLLWILTLVTILILADISKAKGEDLPDAAYVSGVVGHAQGYSISCEARSAADLAEFWGFNVTETAFLQALPSSDNPDQGFVGSPDEVWGQIPPNGYGVHAGPVAETLRSFGLQAEARRNLDWDAMRSEINTGRPVIIWVIGSMWSGTPVDYQAKDGSIARVAAYEHTMLLTGYTTTSVQVIDAGSGQYEYYWLENFLNSWSVLGNMAVFASSTSHQQVKAAPEILGDTYTVQTGDHLMALAREFGVSWQELAAINSISYPYTIYTGQVLRLPEGVTMANVNEPEPEPAPIELASRAKTVKSRLSERFKLHNYIPSNAPASTSMNENPEPIETAIVLNTNSVIGFGRSIGMAWHVLALLNNLSGTDIVHAGQVLRVR